MCVIGLKCEVLFTDSGTGNWNLPHLLSAAMKVGVLLQEVVSHSQQAVPIDCSFSVVLDTAVFGFHLAGRLEEEEKDLL